MYVFTKKVFYLNILTSIDKCNSTTETLSLCDANCELTCQDATSQCYGTNCQTGCICLDDYIRDNVTNTCINPDNCPSKSRLKLNYFTIKI